MKLIGLSLVVAIGLASGSSPAAQNAPSDSQRKLLGPMANVLLDRVGEWDVRADLRLQPAARAVTIKAKAKSKMLGNRWLVTELRGADMGRGVFGFEGLGVNGFDPDTGKYVGYWVDGSRGIAIPVTGTFDAASGIFRTTSVERNRDGSKTTVHSETRRTAPDTEVTTFTAVGPKGQRFVRMVLTYTRAGRSPAN